MKPEEIDIDWLFLIEKIETIMDLGEELLRRQTSEAVLDPQILAQYGAFVWTRDGAGGFFREIATPDIEPLDDFIGLEDSIHTIRRNTLQFIMGHPANNLLLWGDKGSGKSSCIKGLLGEFSHLGLRLIEVHKEDFGQLPLVLHALRTLPYHFILYCDDLSFSENDISYRELKTILEGGIERRPQNVIVYATSNRRHLLTEKLHENDSWGSEIHPEEARAEKLSLADRFGLRIPFYSIDQKTYLKIISHKLNRIEVRQRISTYKLPAIQWATSHGGFSGRIAQQFVTDYAGRYFLSRELKSPRKDKKLDFTK